MLSLIVYLQLSTDLGDDSQCTRGKAVELHIKYLGRQIDQNNLGQVTRHLSKEIKCEVHTTNILFALYNLMHMLTGMQTQAPLLI